MTRRWSGWRSGAAPESDRILTEPLPRGGPGTIPGPPCVVLLMTDQTSPTPNARYAVSLSESEWRQKLSAAEFHVLREAGTERPFTGEYTDTKTEGVYSCRGCGSELFRSDAKFDSHCGWPSFFEPLAGDRVEYLEDRSIPGRPRVEVRCATCGSHLGHAFSGEGYGTPTDQRYCINSVCLTLLPQG